MSRQTTNRARARILSVDPKSGDQETIHQAAALINKGGLVVFPTSTFYGLGAHAFDTEAVGRIFRVKRRDPKKPILILIANLDDLNTLVQLIPNAATRLIEAFWPGGLTLVFQAADVLPKNLTGHSGKIGIRLAGHPVASALAKAAGNPITGTSANISGRRGCSAVGRLDREVRNQVDLVLDAGKLRGAVGSTVVDVSEDSPRILRQGVISEEEVWRVLRG